MGLFRKSEETSQRKTVRGELNKNINNSFQMAKEMGNGYLSSGTQLKKRRQKSYAVEDGVSIEEFMKSFRNFRIQMSIYVISFFICLCLLPFIESKIYVLSVMTYIALVYTIYIRDIHRCRMVLSNWDLRHTPMPLTWKSYMSEVRKNPIFITPFAK